MGRGRPKGYKLSEEAKARIGAANSHPMDDSTKEKLSEALKGNTNRRGLATPVEVREKISLSRMGHVVSKETRAKISKANKGRRVSKETRDKLSRAMRGIPRFYNRGENHPRWRGGVTPENVKIRSSIELRLWREAVFARDNWTCQKCGDNTGGNLNAHHIKPFAKYPELRVDINNGITLCVKCHKHIHEVKL